MKWTFNMPYFKLKPVNIYWCFYIDFKQCAKYGVLNNHQEHVYKPQLDFVGHAHTLSHQFRSQCCFLSVPLFLAYRYRLYFPWNWFISSLFNGLMYYVACNSAYSNNKHCGYFLWSQRIFNHLFIALFIADKVFICIF